MTIKTILVPLYDSALDTVVVDAAAKLAGQLNAHLESPSDFTSRCNCSSFATAEFANDALSSWRMHSI